MPLNTPKTRRIARRALARKWVVFESLATDIQELCGAEKAESPPACFEPGAMNRVTGLSPWRNWDTERALLNGGRGEHGATVAYLLENVELAGGHLYCGAAKLQIGPEPERWILPTRTDTHEADDARLVTSWAGANFFGPFLKCDLPLELVHEGHSDNFTIPTRPYEHAAGYRQLFGLPELPRLERARFRRLTYYTDYAQNSYKVARYRSLRDRVRRSLSSTMGPTHEIVYLKRGPDGEKRRLTNEAQVIDWCERNRIHVLDPTAMDAAQIALELLESRLVIGVEGSHLSHAIFSLHDAGTLLVLQPPDRFALAFKEFTDCFGMTFGFVVGEKNADGFSVSLEDLSRLLNRL